MPAVAAVMVGRAAPAVQAVPGMQRLADRVGLVPPVATILVSLVPLRVRLVRQAMALPAVMAVALVTVARVVMQVLVVAEPAVTRSPVPRATRIPVAPVAPVAAGQAVPVPVVARPVVMVVPQAVVLRVLLRAVPGPVEPVQVLPQAIVPAVRAARAAAVPAVLRRLAEQQAATGRVGTRAPVTRRAELAVPVVQARAELVVPARVAPEARVTVVPRPVAPAVPAVPRLQVQEERLRPVLVATGRPPAVPGLAVPRAAREPQELVVQEPVAQGPPVRLPECPGMPGPSEPRRPRVAQVPQAERVVPAVMPRMALRRTAVLRPETGPWVRSVQQAGQVEQVRQAAPAAVALQAVPVVLAVSVGQVEQVELVEWAMVRRAVPVERVGPRP